MSNVEIRQQCPECAKNGGDTNKDNLVVFVDGGANCFKCGYTTKGEVVLNKKTNDTLQWLEGEHYTGFKNRGISETTAREFGVCIKTYKGTSQVVAFPRKKKGKIVGYKLRLPDKKFLHCGDCSEADPFGYGVNGSKQRLFITEGELDALAVREVVPASQGSVWSLPDGASSVDKLIKKNHAKLNEFERIILVFDNDEAGESAVQEFLDSKAFSVGRIAVARLSENDPCDMLKAGKHEELKWACLQAVPDKPDGVLRVGDITDEYFNYVFERGVDLPFPMLNNCLGGLRKGELTMVASGTGLGKSTVCTNIVYDFITNKKLKIADIKLEEEQRKSIYAYMAMYHKISPRQFRENPKLINEEQRKDFISTFSDLYVHDHFGSLGADNLLQILEYYAVIEKVDYIFLDHVSIAVSGVSSSREGERKDIDKLVTKIRELIHRTGVGFVCVSHLSNPKEGTDWEEGRSVNRSALRGSGSLAQLSDNIIGLEGNLKEESVKNDRKIKLIKSRYGEAQEVYCDTFQYDVNTGHTVLKKEVI